MFRTLLAAALTLAFASSASAAPMTVDNFTTSVFVLQLGLGTTSSASQSGAGILGSRIVTVNNTLVANPSDFAAVNIAGGTAGLGSTGGNNTTNSFTSFETLSYTFSMTDLSGFSAMLTVFAFDAGTPTGPVVLTVRLTDTSSGLQTLAPININGNGPLTIPFGSVDRDQATNITFQFQLNNGADLTLTNGGIRLLESSPVPEPATIATLGLMGLFGGYFARRKLKAGSVAQA